MVAVLPVVDEQVLREQVWRSLRLNLIGNAIFLAERLFAENAEEENAYERNRRSQYMERGCLLPAHSRWVPHDVLCRHAQILCEGAAGGVGRAEHFISGGEPRLPYPMAGGTNIARFSPLCMSATPMSQPRITYPGRASSTPCATTASLARLPP